MDLTEFAAIVEDMVIQHDYPGLDVRSVRLGLPRAVMGASPGLIADALGHDQAVVRLAALRWFQEKSGLATRYIKKIAELLQDEDEWVRLETIKVMGKLDNLGPVYCDSLAACLKDKWAGVRKEAAKVCGKQEKPSESMISALKIAATDADIEVRWKAQKAMRKLGCYADAGEE